MGEPECCYHLTDLDRHCSKPWFLDPKELSSSRNTATYQLSPLGVLLDLVNFKCNAVAGFLANSRLSQMLPRFPSFPVLLCLYVHKELVLRIFMSWMNSRCWLLYNGKGYPVGPCWPEGDRWMAWQTLGCRLWDGDRLADSHSGDEINPSIRAFSPRHQLKHRVWPRLPFQDRNWQVWSWNPIITFLWNCHVLTI